MSKQYDSLGSRALCTVSTGSMTMAIKARRLLMQRNITVAVRELATQSTRRGCIYGIEYPCELSGNILSVLREADIEVTFPSQ